MITQKHPRFHCTLLKDRSSVSTSNAIHFIQVVLVNRIYFQKCCFFQDDMATQLVPPSKRSRPFIEMLNQHRYGIRPLVFPLTLRRVRKEFVCDKSMQGSGMQYIHHDNPGKTCPPATGRKVGAFFPSVGVASGCLRCRAQTALGHGIVPSEGSSSVEGSDSGAGAPEGQGEESGDYTYRKVDEPWLIPMLLRACIGRSPPDPQGKSELCGRYPALGAMCVKCQAVVCYECFDRTKRSNPDGCCERATMSGDCGTPLECSFCGAMSLKNGAGGQEIRSRLWQSGGQTGLAETEGYRTALFDRCGDDSNCGFQPLDGEIRICDAILAEMLEVRKAIYAARAAANQTLPPPNEQDAVPHSADGDGGGFPQSIALLLPLPLAPPLVFPGAVVSDEPSSISGDDVVDSTTPIIGERPPDASGTVASNPAFDGGGNSSPVPSVPAPAVKPETPQVGKFAHHEVSFIMRKW